MKTKSGNFLSIYINLNINLKLFFVHRSNEQSVIIKCYKCYASFGLFYSESPRKIMKELIKLTKTFSKLTSYRSVIQSGTAKDSRVAFFVDVCCKVIINWAIIYSYILVEYR